MPRDTLALRWSGGKRRAVALPPCGPLPSALTAWDTNHDAARAPQGSGAGCGRPGAQARDATAAAASAAQRERHC
jgi:hypothetical protein